MVLSGQSPDGRLVEIVELADHPWFVASQFHPEFKSRPERPHPLFDGFVAASIAVADGREPELRARPEPSPGVPVATTEPVRRGRCRRVRPRRLTSPSGRPSSPGRSAASGRSIGGGAALGAAAWLSDELGYPLGLLLPGQRDRRLAGASRSPSAARPGRSRPGRCAA